MLHHDKIYTKKVPLHYIISFSQFLDRVVEGDERPEKPDVDEAPKLCDDIWKLAQRCWVKEPHLRPTAKCLCETISEMLETRGP